MDVKKSKILHITKYYYPFLGGIEQVTRDIVNVFIEMGAEQKVICFNEDASDGKFLCKHNESVTDIVDGVEVIRCGYFFKFASQALPAKYGSTLKNLINDFSPDLVILHYPNPFATHYLLRHKNKKFKLLVYWHLDITRQRFLKRLFYYQTINLIKRADKILGATPKNLNESEFSQFFASKKHMLPLMVNEQNLTMTKDEIELSEKLKIKYADKILCFFLGRHVQYKGISYLIEASKELNNENIKIVIAGNGELTKSLKAKAKDDQKIEFIGQISDSEKKIYLYSCNIFCFPSITKNEAFGIALAEGMYFGKPAVTFTIPGSGVNYVNLDGVTGIECPNCDYKAYAKAIKKLSDDLELRNKMGNAARQRILDNFTAERFKNNILSIVGSLE